MTDGYTIERTLTPHGHHGDWCHHLAVSGNIFFFNNASFFFFRYDELLFNENCGILFVKTEPTGLFKRTVDNIYLLLTNLSNL